MIQSPPQPPLSPRARAQLGNHNAQLGPQPKAALLSIRCTRADKATWVRAANAAKASGELEEELDHGAPAVLPAWVIKNLNEVAARAKIAHP